MYIRKLLLAFTFAGTFAMHAEAAPNMPSMNAPFKFQVGEQAADCSGRLKNSEPGFTGSDPFSPSSEYPGFADRVLAGFRSLRAKYGNIRVTSTEDGKGVVKDVLYPKARNGYPVFPPECFDNPKAPEYCNLKFNPYDYKCPNDQAIFWRQSIITEYRASEDGAGGSLGFHTNAPMKSLQNYLANKKAGKTTEKSVVTVSSDPELGLARVFIPGVDRVTGSMKADGTADPIPFRVEDKGASNLFDMKGHPILSYPLGADGKWSIPKSAWPSSNTLAPLRIDIRTTRLDSVKSTQKNAWWAAICVSNAALEKAELKRNSTPAPASAKKSKKLK